MRFLVAVAALCLASCQSGCDHKAIAATRAMPGQLKVLTGSGRLLLTCDLKSPTDAANCRLQAGATLDEVMTVILESLDRHEKRELPSEIPDHSDIAVHLIKLSEKRLK